MFVAVCAQVCLGAEEPKGARGAGHTFAKQLIKPALKNPGSADFDWETVKVDKTFKVKPKEGEADSEIVSVSGIVRATNSFNAVVPSKWQVVMNHNDDGWVPIVATHDGEIIFKTELGERFLNTLRERENKKKEEEEAKRKRAQELQSCYDAGRKSGEATATKFGRNVKTAPDSLVDKQAAKALKASGYSDEEESERFLEGFRDAIAEAKKD